METLTLQNASGVIASLSVDVTGSLYKGSDAIITAPLLYSWSPTSLKLTDSNGTVRNLTSSIAGSLLWNAQEVQLRQNAVHQINVVSPLTVSGSNIITIDTLWKPSTVTANTGITSTSNDTLGTLTLGLDGTESRSTLKLIDTQSVVRNLTSSIAGSLLWNTDQVALMNDLNAYSTTAQMNTLLTAKQDTLTAGSNITISNNTISATSTINPLVVQLDGVTQTSVTTLNFVLNNSLLSGGVLNVSRLTHYDKIPLIYSTIATIKDITQDVNANLLWGTDILTTNSYLNSTLASYSTTSQINTLLSAYTYTTQLTNLLNGKVDDAQVLTNVPINAVFTDTLYVHPSQHQIATISGLQTALDAKQATLIAGTNITISNNTISTNSGLIVQVGGVTQTASTLNFVSNVSALYNGILSISRLTQYDKIPLMDGGLSTIRDLESDVSGTLRWDNDAVITNTSLNSSLSGYSTTAQMNAWVNANFLSPLNPGTVGVTAGLSATMTANTFIISVDQNFDRRNLFILEDANLVLRNITTSTNGTLVYDNINLASEPYVTSALSSYSTTAFLQPRLDTIDKLVDTPSGISMGVRGDTNLVDTRVACYERDGSLGQTPGHYFYGMGVYSGGGQSGLALWGSTGLLQPDHGSGSGVLPHLFVKYSGEIAIGGHVAPTEKLHVVGNILCSGNISATSASSAVKSFEIKHPDPEKNNTHKLRHWCVESDVAGGMVMYTKQIEMSTTSETFSMPDWFKHLTKNVIVFVTPYKHFGSGWGECVDNTLHVHTSTKGHWNVLITASRKDHCATTQCPQEVEYIEAEPVIDNTNAFPPTQ